MKPIPWVWIDFTSGLYHGIRQDNKLVAMVGSRTPHYREISAVCTHPKYRGKGYGSLLTKILSHKFQQNGLIPYLIVVHSKVDAKRLYEKLGFEVHQELHGMLIRRCPD